MLINLGFHVIMTNLLASVQFWNVIFCAPEFALPLIVSCPDSLVPVLKGGSGGEISAQTTRGIAAQRNRGRARVRSIDRKNQ